MCTICFSILNFSSEETFCVQFVFNFEFQQRGGIYVYNQFFNFQFQQQEAFVCTICFSIFNFSSEEAFVCTICFSTFNFSSEEAFCVKFVFQFSISVARRHFVYNLYFKFQFSISAARRQGISQVGRRRLTPLALPVPNTPHLGIPSIRRGSQKILSFWVKSLYT